MTVIQPYKYDSQNDYPSEFEIEINPIEEMYNQILNHRYNRYTKEMASSFADQENGKGEYIVEFYDDLAMITTRNSKSVEERLADLL